MIFLGDLACPENKIDAFLDCINHIDVFKDEVIVINFEANIVDSLNDRKELTLYNLSRITEFFKQAKKVVVSLANNHMNDYPDKILKTREILESSGINTFGLFENNVIKPFIFTDNNGEKIALFGHCWRLYTHTNINRENDVRVVDCPYDEFADVVGVYISEHPDVKVYCFMHWNYDLEQYPFPVHRKLSKRLIDFGACGVIGCHSHRPQGLEIYKNKPIAYGLGNFYLPSGIYFNGKLSYPECSKRTYGIRINNSVCDRLWFDTDKSENDLPVCLTSVEKDIVHHHDFADYIDLDDKAYLDFFKKHRTKRFLVPVFTELGGLKMACQEKWAIQRVKMLRQIKRWMRK